MRTFGRIIFLGSLGLGIAGVALAQGQETAQQQSPAQTDQRQQHQGQDYRQQGQHQEGCECCCCRMMSEMMQGHGMDQRGSTGDQPRDHQHRGTAQLRRFR